MPENFDFGVNAPVMGGQTPLRTPRTQLEYPLDAESKGTLKLALEDVEKDVIRKRNRIQFTIASGATLFEVASDYMVLTGAAAVTIAIIKGGREGQILTLQFTDANVTITDDATGAADTTNLNGSFVSVANAVLQLLFDGTSWREVSRRIATDISATNAAVLVSTDFSATGRLGNAGTNDATTTVGTSGLNISSAGAQNAGKTLQFGKPNVLCLAGQNYLINISFKFAGVQTSHFYFVGLQDADDTVSIADTGITTSGALCMGIKGVGDGTNIDMTSINADGAGNETSNAFISNQASDTWNSIQILVTGTTDIKFYNNGTLVNTHTTNLPINGGSPRAWQLIFASANDGTATAVTTVASASITQLL